MERFIVPRVKDCLLGVSVTKIIYITAGMQTLKFWKWANLTRFAGY